MHLYTWFCFVFSFVFTLISFYVCMVGRSLIKETEFLRSIIKLFLSFLKIFSHLKIKYLLHAGVYIMYQLNKYFIKCYYNNHNNSQSLSILRFYQKFNMNFQHYRNNSPIKIKNLPTIALADKQRRLSQTFLLIKISWYAD